MLASTNFWESGLREPSPRSRQGSSRSQKGWTPSGRFSLMAQTTGYEQATLLSMVTRRVGYLEVQNGAKIIAFSTNHVMRVQLPLITCNIYVYTCIIMHTCERFILPGRHTTFCERLQLVLENTCTSKHHSHVTVT